jgi:putative transposase
MCKPVGRKTLPHDVPMHVTPNAEGDIFFITIGCENRGFNQLAKDSVWNTMMETWKLREERGEIGIRLVLAMPDHLHALLSFHGVKPMRQIIRDFKSWMVKTHQIDWERGFFDHRIRTWESGVEKGEYIRNNPVRAGLVSKRGDWPYVYDSCEAPTQR